MSDPFAHAAAGFRAASTGFRLLAFTLVGGLVLVVVGRVLLDALFGMRGAAARDLLQLAAFLLGGLVVAALVVTLVGRGKALAAPHVTRTRQAWGAGALSLGGFGVLVALAGLAAVVLEVRNFQAQRALFLLALVLWGFGELFFLLFAKGVAEAVRRDDLTTDAGVTFRAGAWAVVLAAVGAVLADAHGNLRLVGVAFVVIAVVCALSALGRYQRLLSGLADALRNPTDDVLLGLDDPDDDPGW